MFILDTGVLVGRFRRRIRVASRILDRASNLVMGKTLIFDEKYRVVGIERDRLLLRGVQSGDVVTVLNSQPGVPLTQEEYPVGKLVALTDPSSAPLN
jgi:hypothetical protein